MNSLSDSSDPRAGTTQSALMRAGVRLAPISAAGKEEERAGDGVPAPGKRLCRAPVPAERREMGTRRPRQRLTHHASGSSRVGAGHGATGLHAGALREGEWKGRRSRGATPGQRMLEPFGRA